MAEKGYIRLSRGFFDTHLWTEPRVYSSAEAWLDLIRMARFESTVEIIINREIEVGRGEIPASRRFLEARWQWSNTKVENFLKRLQKRRQITLRYTNGQTVISLCNYEKYNPISRGRSAGGQFREAPPERRQNACEASKIINLNKENDLTNTSAISRMEEEDTDTLRISKIKEETMCGSLTGKGEKCGLAAELSIGGRNYCRHHAVIEMQNLGIIEAAEKDRKFDLGFAPEEFRPLIQDWLSYKKARKQSYKTQQSVRLFYKQLIELSGGRAETARGIIEKSIANNWSGIFEFKTNNYGTGRQNDRCNFGASEKNYETKSTLI